MGRSIENPWRGQGLRCVAGQLPISNVDGVARLLAQCPIHKETPLIQSQPLAEAAGVCQFFIKDERDRMGLGSFKALGAAYAIARQAAARSSGDWATALAGETFVTASAGNHGLSVAAGAKIFGARAVIYLSDIVPAAFATRLAKAGADVMVEGVDYEASMAAAERRASDEGWSLLSDSSWDGYVDAPKRVMEGYLQLAAETERQMPEVPTHIFLQAGVGGIAAAVAVYLREKWGPAPQIIVVEPEAAPALHDSIQAGRSVETTGPVSSMGRLDCKTPSLIALNGLSRDADRFQIISEAEAATGVAALAQAGIATTPSGAAGVAAVLAETNLPADACVLAIVTEGTDD